MDGKGGSGLQATFSKVTELAEVELSHANPPRKSRGLDAGRLLHNSPCSKFLPYAEPDLPFGVTENTELPSPPHCSSEIGGHTGCPLDPLFLASPSRAISVSSGPRLSSPHEPAGKGPFERGHCPTCQGTSSDRRAPSPLAGDPSLSQRGRKCDPKLVWFHDVWAQCKMKNAKPLVPK